MERSPLAIDLFIFAALCNTPMGKALGCGADSPVGLGREPQQAENHQPPEWEKLMVFRVCGNKGIACTVAFVYTQALLAPLLQICSAGFSVVYRKINASDCFAMWRKHIWVVI